jgi:hypothetical protein
MAVTWPHPTYTNGVTIAAADLNIIRDNSDFVHGYGARVYNSANISIANNTAVALTFDTERYDDNTFHSTSSNTSRLTIPVTRRYQVGASVVLASNATGYRQVYFLVNGTTTIARMTIGANPGAVTELVLAGVDWSFTAADYVEVYVVQNSGGALNVTAVSAYSPEFWIRAC